MGICKVVTIQLTIQKNQFSETDCKEQEKTK